MQTYHSEILSEIANTPLVSIFGIEEYGRKNRYELSFLYSIGSITEDDLTQAVSKAVIMEGLKNYEYIKDGRMLPDHVPSTEALAYVLSDEKLLLNDPKKWKGIKFDHGENIRTFCERYGDDELIEKLKTKLMDPKELKPSSGIVHEDYSSHHH